MTGVDRSARFVKLGSSAGVPGAQFVRADARALPCRNGSFDVAISLCQGGFGLLGGHDDGDVLCEMAQAVKMGGYVVVSAFSAYFQLRFLEDSDAFDADAGVNHERTEIRSPTGAVLEADLWTTCFTPRELRLLAERAGLTVKHLWSVTPGRYGRFSPTTDLPEFLLVAQRQIHGVGTEEHAVLT